ICPTPALAALSNPLSPSQHTISASPFSSLHSIAPHSSPRDDTHSGSPIRDSCTHWRLPRQNRHLQPHCHLSSPSSTVCRSTLETTPSVAWRTTPCRAPT